MPKETLPQELVSVGELLRALFTFFCFVLAAALTGTGLISASGGLFSWEAIGSYALPVALVSAPFLPPLISFIRKRAWPRGIADIGIGAFIGFFSTAVLMGVAFVFQPSWNAVWLGGWILGVNSAAGAVGGLAYWLAAGLPSRPIAQPTSS